MRLTEVETGSTIFLDANIFIYHFTGIRDECINFPDRGGRGQLAAITTVIVILEVLHSLMMVEAIRKDLIKLLNMVRFLS